MRNSRNESTNLSVRFSLDALPEGYGTLRRFGCEIAPNEETDTLNSFDKFRLEARLEALCEKGCRYVWHDIDALERGEDLPETRDLNKEERSLLLRELRQIMAVYADRCSAA